MSKWNPEGALAMSCGKQLAPVVHGVWEIHTDEYDCEYMKCSACNEEFYPIDEDTVDRPYNYCPHCGAKMDGGTE